jgi:hypothetical protein
MPGADTVDEASKGSPPGIVLLSDGLGARSRSALTVDGPTVVSFSGGRTSAYLLRRLLDWYGGRLPTDCHVVFANTGKEEEATLRFVRECGERWGAVIRWVEWEKGGYREVNFDTASRDGEPFEDLVRHRSYLPNPVTRFCTSELKIRTMHRFLRANWQALGWEADDLEWNQMIGIRADEARRVAKYPGMKLVAVRPSDDFKDKAQSEATALMSAYPNLKLLMAICTPGVPGADTLGLLSRLAGGTCLAFVPGDPTRFFVGCDDGTLARCSTSFGERPLEVVHAHPRGPV